MPNEYLVQIHDYIGEQIARARQNKLAAQRSNDIEAAWYCEGRLQELQALRKFISDNFDLLTQVYF